MYNTMEFAIERLSHLIHTTVTKIDREPLQIETIKDQSEELKAAIKHYLLKKSQLATCERELEIVVQESQAEIIVSLDQLNEISDIPDIEVLKILRDDLRDTLTFIENRYSKYFCVDARVPECYLQLTQQDLLRSIKKLKKYLSHLKNITDLIPILESPVKHLSKRKGTTFKELMYLKKLYSSSEDIMSKGVKGLTEQDVYDFLVYSNFNSYGFITHYINIISFEVNSLHDSNERIEKLAFHLKRINQMHLKPGAALRSKVASVKEQVTNWISEELYFLEKKQRLMTVIPTLKDEPTIVDEEKLHLSVSVDVLTLLARAAKDSKLILNQQMTGMYKSMSKFCRTVNTENPSAHSMLKKSYVAERNAKQTAVNILHEMIKHLHRY